MKKPFTNIGIILRTFTYVTPRWRNCPVCELADDWPVKNLKIIRQRQVRLLILNAIHTLIHKMDPTDQLMTNYLRNDIFAIEDSRTSDILVIFATKNLPNLENVFPLYLQSRWYCKASLNEGHTNNLNCFLCSLSTCRYTHILFPVRGG